MQHLIIPLKRAELLTKPLLGLICKRLECSVQLQNGNELVIKGDALSEYNAMNVMQAFGRGFSFNTACKLLSDDYFFKSIDLKEVLKNQNHIRRIKARIIGKEGKTKSYVQAVSGVDLMIYGDTVSLIGKVDEIKVALAAITVLLESGTHNKAYTVMEKTKRRMNG
jgi:ribosomal RNA assembly protein